MSAAQLGAWLMRLVMFASLVFLAVPYALACRIPSRANTSQNGRVADLSLQKQYAFELARQADLIMLAHAVEIDPPYDRDSLGGAYTARFEVTRMLKGHADPVIAVPFVWTIVVSCGAINASENFRSNYIEAGKQYLVYVKSGSILRAADTRRVSGELALWVELKEIERAR